MKREKKKYHHGNLKEELIIQAARIIQEKGEEVLTLKDLSKILNITPPALYRHFSSREDLIVHVINRAFEEYDRDIFEIEANEEYTCLEKFYFFGRKYIEFAIKNPNLFNIMFGTRFSSIKNISNRKEAKGLHLVIDRFIEAQKNNFIKKDDPLKQVTVIHSAVHGLAKLYINNYRFVKENLDSLYDTSFEIIMGGLMVNPEKLKEEIEIIKKKRIEKF